MSVIIPYNEKWLAGDGGFIKPNGEFMSSWGGHERFSRNYCFGNNYDYLSRVVSGDTYDCSEELWESLKKEYNYQGKKEDFDVFSSTKLTKEQLVLFKQWVEKYEFGRKNLYSDFMVYILGFDRFCTIMKRVIVTTCPQPHLRFYNYCLMDYEIDYCPKMVYNNQISDFEYDEDVSLFLREEDQKLKLEIDEIKSKIKKRDRSLFFK